MTKQEIMVNMAFVDSQGIVLLDHVRKAWSMNCTHTSLLCDIVLWWCEVALGYYRFAIVEHFEIAAGTAPFYMLQWCDSNGQLKTPFCNVVQIESILIGISVIGCYVSLYKINSYALILEIYVCFKPINIFAL